MFAYSLGEVWYLVMFFLSLINWEVVILAGLAAITWFYARQTAVIAKETKDLAKATVTMADFAEKTFKESLRPDLDIRGPSSGREDVVEGGRTTALFARRYDVTNNEKTVVILKSIEGPVGSKTIRLDLNIKLRGKGGQKVELTWPQELGDRVGDIVLRTVHRGVEHDWRPGGVPGKDS